MTSSRRILLVGLSALTLSATFFLSTGCQPKKSLPEAFTAQLTELPGVQAVYTLRHPKLILGDLEKLMSAVPEAALLRMGLAQLTPYGYPEFSDLAAGANVGVALLALTPEELSAGKPTMVAFAKLKEGGKIATLLAQTGLVLEKKGEWTWIAQNAAAFAKVKDVAALTAYISRPQTEELRVWGRLTPELMARAKEFIVPLLEEKLTDRPEAEKKALGAYFDVVWNYLVQLHSLGGALDFNDQGVALAYSTQFLPESATGTFLRYPPGPAPKIAQSLPNDGLMTMVMRQNIDGQIEFARTLMDALIAVDYPAGTELLKAAKASYLGFAENSDGGAVFTFNLKLPKAGEQPVIDLLGVQSGRFTEAQVTSFYKDSIALSRSFTNTLLSAFSVMTPAAPKIEISQQLTENALTIEGIRFGSIITHTKTAVGGKEQTTSTTQFYGVVAGNLVSGINEAALRERVPALAAKRAVPNSLEIAFTGDQVAVLAIHGAKIVDLVAEGANANVADPDIQAQLSTLKTNYTQGGPIRITIGASQAQGSLTLLVPYTFIAQSVRLGQFASASKAMAK